MTKSQLLRSRDAFMRGYFEAALWSSLDDNDRPMDEKYSGSDLSVKAIKSMIQDCKEFQQENASLLAQAYEDPGYDEERAGFDFWLTRNRHGAGFWDRGLPYQVGRALTDAAHAYGSSDLYTVRGAIWIS